MGFAVTDTCFFYGMTEDQKRAYLISQYGLKLFKKFVDCPKCGKRKPLSKLPCFFKVKIPERFKDEGKI